MQLKCVLAWFTNILGCTKFLLFLYYWKIDFSFFHKLTTKLNLKSEAIVTQGEFLKRMGIIERANILSSNKNFKEKSEIFYRLKRLIHPNEMGNLFKVFFFKKKGIKFNLGFI